MTRSTHADNFVRPGQAVARLARDARRLGSDTSGAELDIHEATARAVDNPHPAGS